MYTNSAGSARYEYEPEHCFLIRNDPQYGILAGRSRDAQWLISDEQDGTLVIKFNAPGNLIDTFLLDGKLPNERRDERDHWKDKIGLTEATISVRRFSLARYGIGITALPSGMQQAVDAPGDLDEEELKMILEDAAGWLKDGQFVLNWGNDYYLSKDGEVVSS